MGAAAIEKQRRLMKTFIALLVWLAFAGAAHGAPRLSSSNSETTARRVCLERARALRYRMVAVRSVNKKGKDNFTVMLRVEGTKRLLTCNYDGRSGVSQLHW